ncbi:MAG TPA: polyprenyl synthetase family protein [Candidatus Hydrogenedentes bacterium]|nr:polyprenyl synthetase family protein [Candidatus Hydrogenedentota bacterium]
MATQKTLEDLYHPVADCLVEVRGEIGRIWEDALRLVRIDAGPMPKAGGKLLRPALCLLSAGAIGGTDLKHYVRLAAAFEALHIASLAHDDVIDRALMRRGNTSLNALWDNHAAVLGGDYLVARAVNLLAGYNSCAVIDNAITSVRRMAEGELYFFGRDVTSVTQNECIQLAEQKTASLFAEACCAPTFVIDSNYHDALHRFGMSLGVAFQIIDDLLDLTQPATSLGKPACGDVAEGKFTLPILFMREMLPPAEIAQLDAMRDTELTLENRTWVSDRVESTGAHEKTMRAAQTFINQALESLLTLPPSQYRSSMEGLAEFILVRHS